MAVKQLFSCFGTQTHLQTNAVVMVQQAEQVDDSAQTHLQTDALVRALLKAPGKGRKQKNTNSEKQNN